MSWQQLFILILGTILISCSNSIDFSTSHTDEKNVEITYDKELYSSWENVDVNNPAIRITGRSDKNDEGEVLVAWSGSAFTIGFIGTALKIMLSTPKSVYDVFVDGNPIPSKVLDFSNCEKCDSTYMVVDNLPLKEHFVRIQRNTEIRYGDAILRGFSVFGKPDEKALPPIPARKIEFIGNSITCGYGVLDTKASHKFSIQTEDHYFSYAGQAARILDAEEHTVCYSGHGLIRNNNNTTSLLLPDLYTVTSIESNLSWDPANWTPDLIFINLGTNDFRMGIPDSSKFVKGTVNFLKKLREFHPLASIILLTGPMMNGDKLKVCKRFLDVSVKTFKETSDKNVYRFDLGTQGTLGYGAENHPNRAQSLINALALADWVKETFNW